MAKPGRPPGKPQRAALEKQIAIRMPQALIDRLDAYLAGEAEADPGLTRTDVIRRLLIRALNAHDRGLW